MSRSRALAGLVVAALTGASISIATPAAAGAVVGMDAALAAGLSVSDVGANASTPVERDATVAARHAAERAIVDVTDFGADPTGATDSAAAVAAAIAHAKSLGMPVTLLFPCGTYDLYPEQAPRRELYVSNTTGDDRSLATKSIGVLIEGMHDVVVEGNGSLLRFHGAQTQFAAIDSTDVSFSGFETDWVAPATVDLTVLATGIDGGSAYRELQIPPGTGYRIDGASATFLGEPSPVTGRPYWELGPDVSWNGSNQVRVLATGETHRSSTPIWNGASRIVERGDNRIRIEYDGKGDPGDAGRVYEMRRTTRDTPGAFVTGSERVDLVGLDFHYLHGFGIVGQMTEDVTIDRVRFARAAGTWRQTAGFADFVQMSGVAGTVQVLNSTFDNPHDDPINVHGTYVQVTGVDRSARTVTLRYMHPETAGFPQFHPGDELRFVRNSTMLPLEAGALTVDSVDGPSGRDHDHDLREMTVKLSQPIPDEVEVDGFVAENLTYTPEVRIAGNTFVSVPTRGILVTSPKPVVIERNLFDQMSMASIYVSGDARSWYESGAIDGLVIRQNVFDRPSTSSPVIFFDPTNSRTEAGRTVHRDVTIEQNRFNVLPGTEVLRARSVSELRFTGNAVLPYAPTTPPDPTTASDRALFHFEGSAGIVIDGNEFAPGFNLRADASDMDASEVGGSDGVAVNADHRLAIPGAALAEGFAWVREDPARWQAVDEDAVRFVPGDSGLWATQNAAVNLLLHDADQTATEAVVELDGATKAGWEEAGLVLYVGDDDYVALHRKHANGSPVLALVTEEHGRPDEHVQLGAPAAERVWLKLVRAGDDFTASFSTDGTTFTAIGTITNQSVARGTARAGVMAEGRYLPDTSFVLRDLLIDGAAAPFFATVPAVPQPVASASVAWDGVDPGAPVAPNAWSTSLDAAVASISGAVEAGEGIELAATLNGRPLAIDGGRLEVPLAAGPNIVELRTAGPDGGQTYRWAFVSKAVGAPTAAPSCDPGDAMLAALTLDDRLVPGFAPERTAYEVQVDGAVPHLDAVAASAGARVTVEQPSADGATPGRVLVESADGAVTTEYRVQVTPSAPVPVSVTAESRCLAGRAYVAVAVSNSTDGPLDLEIRSAFGTKRFTGIAPGAHATHAFTTRLRSLPADTVDVVVQRQTGGPVTVTAGYPAADCR